MAVAVAVATFVALPRLVGCAADGSWFELSFEDVGRRVESSCGKNGGGVMIDTGRTGGHMGFTTGQTFHTNLKWRLSTQKLPLQL